MKFLLLLLGAAMVASESKLYSSSKVCSLNSHLDEVLSRFVSAGASSKVTAKNAVTSATRTRDSQQATTTTAVATYTEKDKIATAARSKYSSCIGTLKSYKDELAAQTPLIQNEQQCIATLNKHLDTLEGVSEEEEEEGEESLLEVSATSAMLANVPEELQQTESFASATKFLERKSRTSAGIRVYLKSLQTKLDKELASLKNRVTAQSAQCTKDLNARRITAAARTVALDSKTLHERRLALRNTQLTSRQSTLRTVSAHYSTEVSVARKTKLDSKKVCSEYKKNTRTTETVCSMHKRISGLFNERQAQKNVFERTKASKKASRDTANAALGRANQNTAAAKKTRDAKVGTYNARVATRQQKERDLGGAATRIKKEKRVIATLREKASCLTKASRSKRTNCAGAARALAMLERNVRRRGASTELLQVRMLSKMTRKHAQIGKINQLLNVLDKNLDAELNGLSGALNNAKAAEATALKEKKTAESAYAGSAAAAAAASTDYANKRNSYNSWVAAVSKFDSDRAAEEKAMKSVQATLQKVGTTTNGKGWSKCR